jgi:hypothetical protein
MEWYDIGVLVLLAIVMFVQEYSKRVIIKDKEYWMDRYSELRKYTNKLEEKIINDLPNRKNQ